MNIIIRADASFSIGSGHIMRCLNLATMLKANGACIEFICRQEPGNMSEIIRQHGFNVSMIEIVSGSQRQNHESLYPDWAEDAQQTSTIIQQKSEQVDWIIVDHYGLDIKWEQKLRAYTQQLFIIDDLVNRHHDCDILLDQNLHHNAQRRYQILTPDTTTLLLGPRYALLNTQFNDPALQRQRTERLSTLLIYFGGSDPDHQIFKVISALNQVNFHNLSTTIVLGPVYPQPEKVEQAVKSVNNIQVLRTTQNMPKLMFEADLAIGTCGISAWERCILGLPTIVIITAENQREDAEILSEAGAIINLGDAHQVTSDDYLSTLHSLVNHPQQLARMSQASKQIIAERHLAAQHIHEVFFGKH